MNDAILRRELRRIAIENEHRCFGCGFEHKCSLHGCANIRAALERLAPVSAGPANAPLTVEELREMEAEWVWIKFLVPVYGMETGYCIKKARLSDADKFCCGYPGLVVRDLEYTGYGDSWLAYRRKPEEANHAK